MSAYEPQVVLLAVTTQKSNQFYIDSSGKIKPFNLGIGQ